MGLADSVISIWQGEINKAAQAKGSGFCIAPKLIMTAWHVVKGIDKDDLYIGWTNVKTDAGLRVHEVHRIDGYDVAILELHKKHNNQILQCDFETELDNGLKVELVAYNVIQKKHRGPLEKQIANEFKDDQHWEFDTYPAKGMSGGAVLYNKKVIGIIRARNKEGNSGLLIPIRLCAHAINKILPDLKQRKTTVVVDDYLKSQKNKLIKLLVKSNDIQTSLTSIYSPKYPKIEADKLVELLTSSLLDEEQRERAKGLRAIRKGLLNVFKQQMYDPSLEKTAKKLFNLCLVFAFPECKVENTDTTAKKAHTVMVLELQTLEVVAARLYETTPQLEDSKLGQKGRYAFDCHQFGIRNASWGAEKNVEDFVEQFLQNVFRACSKRKGDTRLLSEREDANNLYYIYVNTSNNEESWLTDEVVNLIKADKNLASLPIFYFGEKEDDLIADVSSIIDGFYNDLNQYIQKMTEKAET